MRTQSEPAASTAVTAVPTVAVFQSTPVVVPTVLIPQPTPTPTPRPVVKRHRKVTKHKTPVPQVKQTWILAYLTSYCPGSAGWISSSGMPVFYGMLANNYYPFGTRIYIPVLGITGVVEDHLSDYSWNHFDVWSASCYSTPTGWFRVAVQGR